MSLRTLALSALTPLPGQGGRKPTSASAPLRLQIASPSFLWPTGTIETPHVLLLKKLRADATQPLACRVVMEAGVPILLDRKAGDRQRAIEHAQSVIVSQRFANVPWQGGDQVSRPDDCG